MLTLMIRALRQMGAKVYADSTGRLACVRHGDQFMFRGTESVESYLGKVLESVK